LIATACADATVRVLDVNGMRRVRTLRCGGKGITGVSKKNGKIGKSAQGDSFIENNVARCLEFSSDGRWVLAAALDGSVRVWDVPASRLLQTMVFSTSSPVTGMSLSPQMDMLATTHAGRRGVYLWANSTMYAPQGGAGTKSTKSTLGVGKNVSSDSEDSDSDDDSSEVRTFVTLPTLHADGDDAEDIVLGSDKKAGELVKETEGLSAQQSEDVLKLAPMAQTAAAKAPAPVPAAPGLATMALLPRSQWLGLLHLDSIRYVFPMYHVPPP
jgi:U3 small nucleolar RNA-associated protein 21